MRSLLLSLVLLGACNPDVNVTKQKIDKDGDGFAEEIDCDDTHATVNPDADEVCDGVDNDCDGTTDVGASDALTFYADTDADGFGDAAAPTQACEATDGLVADDTDCDDGEPGMFPGNGEVCDDLDNDCNGEVDDDPSDLGTFYVDADGDGYGDAATATQACEAGVGEVTDGTDCDDADGAIHPDAAEEDCTDPVDYNCDGSVGYADADGDGSPACADCDDGDEGRAPTLAEVCDEADVDEDCDGTSDDDDDSVTGLSTWGRDADADGYYGSGATVTQCEEPAGYASASGDCDDFDNAANPGELEVCDALDTDEDCDGAADDADASTDAASFNTFYADRDGDAHGDAARTVYQCEAPSNYVTNDDDCDDTDAARNPGEAEVCDAADVDEDCDGLADDSDSGVTGGSTYHADTDGDGYGGASTREACSQPSGYVTNDDDCDDGAAAISPAATEQCDAADTDEDCDGLADDLDSAATGKATWYRDADSDGYAGTTSTSACDQPTGYYATATDCDDGSASISPAASEVCDSANTDEDCDSLADDADASATGRSTWYRDADGDGYAGTTTTSTCDQPTGYLATSTDCNDGSAAISPAAAEICDASNVDEDCDGAADDSDSSATGESTWYRDADSDTYGNASTTASMCDMPTGYVSNDDDCDDTTSSIGSNRTWYRDLDSDGYGGTTTASSCTQPTGYVSTSSDCNDSSSSISPGASEVCDASNVDEDCDSAADDSDTSATGRSTWYRDADSDGYGTTATTSTTCDQPTGYVSDATDCDDTSASISPGDAEICDASDTDEDCDGAADDDDAGGATGKTTWYADADSDGYGTSATSTSACDQPSTYVSSATDCDDGADDAYPGGTEVCDDGIDQDCSGDDEECASDNYSGSYAVNTDYDSKIYGVTASDRFGAAMVAGDFNGDGTGDLVVSATFNTYSTEESTVYGYYGPFNSGVETATTSDDFLYYNTSSSYDGVYGTELHNLGDVNADGKDDLLVSLSTAGYSYLYLGGDTGASAYTTNDDGGFSCDSASTAGDFNATSGTDEWICGYSSYSTAGIAYVYAGTSTTAVATLPGESSSYAGSSVAGGGDVDGDGYDDIWVGAYQGGTSTAGAAYLIYAPVSGTFNLVGADAKITGGAASDYLGYSMSMPGDIDGDGHDDVIVGAYQVDTSATNAGALYVITDPDSGTVTSEAYATILGEDASDSIGFRADSTGDVDGDGEIDLLVMAHGNDDSATNAGAAWLVYGPIVGTINLSTADAEWLGTNSSDLLGISTAIVPDVDADGDDEIALGAYNGDERGYVDHGAVWIWLGQ